MLHRSAVSHGPGFVVVEAGGMDSSGRGFTAGKVASLAGALLLGVLLSGATAPSPTEPSAAEFSTVEPSAAEFSAARASPSGASPAGVSAAEQAQPGWRLPAPAEELRPFAKPPSPWGPGHRGVDLGPLSVGAAVTAPADGEVSFVGVVVDRPVLSIRHGDGYLSSFEPVETALAVGDRVDAGEHMGTLTADTSHCADPCLHWGVRLYGEYINPLLLTGDLEPSVLLPLGEDRG